MEIFYTREVIGKIEAMLAQGLTYRQISQRLGRSYDSIKQIMYQYRNGRLKFVKEGFKEARDKIEQCLQQGMCVQDIASQLGRNPTSVHQTLQVMGIDSEIRALFYPKSVRRVVNPSPQWWAKAVEMGRQGRPLDEIAERFGKNLKHVRTILKRHGVTPISPQPTGPTARLEPDWWADARRFRRRGRTIPQIMALTGMSRSAINYCFSEKVRRNAIENSKARFRANPRKHRTSVRQDWKRHHVRAYARDVWRQNGGDLREHYRRLDCL